MMKKSKEIASWLKDLVQKYILHILIVGTASGGLINGWLSSRISLPEVASLKKTDSIHEVDIKTVKDELKILELKLDLHNEQIINIQKANTKAKPKPRIQYQLKK